MTYLSIDRIDHEHIRVYSRVKNMVGCDNETRLLFTLRVEDLDALLGDEQARQVERYLRDADNHDDFDWRPIEFAATLPGFEAVPSVFDLPGARIAS